MNEINYIAVPRSGDIVGMTAPGETPETFTITSKNDLAIWRTFNRANKDHHKACMSFLKDAKTFENYDHYAEAFNWAVENMRALYGAEIFSKWHARTTWVCKKEVI